MMLYHYIDTGTPNTSASTLFLEHSPLSRYYALLLLRLSLEGAKSLNRKTPLDSRVLPLLPSAEIICISPLLMPN